MNAIVEFQKILHKLPQVKLETLHYFVDGMYCRELIMPAETILVGKEHKRGHFFMVVKGKIKVADGEEEATLREAGYVTVSTPGTKRAMLAMEDSICMTVHRTNKHNLDKIEKELIAPDGMSLYDARNQLKELT